MNIKKSLAITLAAMLVVAPAGISVVNPDAAISTAYAAKGGARISVPRTSVPAAPVAPKATTPSTNSGKSVSGTGNTYAPSKDAKTLSPTAPQAKSNANAAANTMPQQSGSRLGSIMRGIGLFAGGMLLGSLLSNMLGLGTGFLSDMLGLLVNVAIIYIAFMVLRWIWRKIRGTGKSQPSAASNPYARTSTPKFDTANRTFGTAKHQMFQKPDEGKAEGIYDRRQTADKYRRM